jgi:hypothetical protein
MPASNETTKLINTKEIVLFLPVMGELADDLGARFLLSMLHSCRVTIERRLQPSRKFSSFEADLVSAPSTRLNRLCNASDIVWKLR